MRRQVSALIGVLTLSLALGGCGTRMSEDAIEAADGTAAMRAAAAAPVHASASLPAERDVAAPPTTGGGATGDRPATTTAAGTTTAAAPAARRDRPAPEMFSPVQAGAASPCTTALAPVVIGQTAPSSGIIGASNFNMRTGLALWLRDVNARGGVQCHPVQLYQMDDAADPARVTSNLNELVHNKKAIAIVGAGVPTTFAAAKRFAEQHEVPFVGGDLIEAPWFSSPWFFPQGGGPLAAYAGAMKEAARAARSDRIGLVYCVEASICGQINANFEAMAKASRLQVVLRKISSITSPDYTAECQALKSAGADAVFVALEGSGNARFARSCLSLGYTPAVATSALAVTAEAALDPNVRRLGAFLGAGNVPFLATEGVGVRAFRAAYERFAPGTSIDQNTISQYTSGRLFEQAFANVATQARAGALTRGLLLEGLWQVRNETLDGLAPRITFHREAPPSPNDCYGLLHLTNTGYTAPSGGRFTCLSGLPKGF
ncbi:ABC transporter substrate-binding protein [Sporichthya polymorpha]|uniref:ABC transporter substrate-binding protein n=1 Tax=Sporichthya polymorpha TaxID=35751 RepID=UPI00035D8EFC|nr:ABC transporter substrate-binding protein [Sporichthya polymorpha]